MKIKLNSGQRRHLHRNGTIYVARTQSGHPKVCDKFSSFLLEDLLESSGALGFAESAAEIHGT